eukprot:1052365-Pyramimonas_sp.AAC.1
MTTTAPIDDFDFITHAAEDAGRVQSWLTLASSGTLAWTAQESFLVDQDHGRRRLVSGTLSWQTSASQ